MPEIDHRVGQGLEGVVQPTATTKAQQEPPELVFPGEHPLDRAEPFLEHGRIEQRLVTSLGLLPATGVGIDVGDHTAIEDGLAVRSAVIDTVETDDRAPKIQAHGVVRLRG
jgi:hypothetical protein